MTLQEIKLAVDNGVVVHWQNSSYTVIKNFGDYLIKHTNGHMIGLTWSDEVTMNGKEEDFYIPEVALDEFPCLVITLSHYTARSVFDLLESHEIVADSYDLDKNEVIIGLEGLKIDGYHIYDVLHILEQNGINSVKYSIENRTM